ncbi:hypothetical protein RI844_19750 [Thalassotalea fonticola]|uniref:Type IV pilus biogenesis protein PilP n=1 Tax=Thalassotalea fonticola TaxID=3065649 RepID=A0ABZ0GPK3_9GAMM|nr:hypothetical protein RI844_19750 [Colwelliaceae bacterium S1-1]
MKIINNTVLPLAFACTLVSNSVNAMDFDNLHQQLDIMSDIIKSTIKRQSNNQGPRLTRIDSHYLAGQGVVFNLNVSRVFYYGHNNNIPVMPVAPVAPRAPQGLEGEELFGENFEIVIEEAMEEAAIAIEIVNENMRFDVEEQRELREQERELAYELRDLARAERDLNYEKLHLDNDEKAENQKELGELEERKAAIEQAKLNAQKRADEHQRKIEKIQADKAKQQQAYYTKLETTVSEVLCNYGGGLKALPDSEYISMIIKGAGATVEGRIKDKVLVFNKLDVKNCVLERITAPTLLGKANGYQF